MKNKRAEKIEAYLGKTVQVTVDRPLGSYHPEYPDMRYPVNYGYIAGTIGGDGEPQDVYLLGVDEPVAQYTAKVIAIVHRRDDKEDKLVAAPDGMLFELWQIREAIAFQEQHFYTKIKLDLSQRPLVRFYRNDPHAPKTTMPTHLGANAIITCGGKLLLERRRDSNTWGLVGGGVKDSETCQQAIAREIFEELGLQVCQQQLKKIAVYGEPGRIAAYRDGSIWQMVVVVFHLDLAQQPDMRISEESKELRFFSKEELRNIDIVVTHSDIVEEQFVNG